MQRRSFSLLAWGLVLLSGGFAAQGRAGQQLRCVALDVYFRGQESEEVLVRDAVDRFVQNRPGVTVTHYDLDRQEAGNAELRLQSISQHYRFAPNRTPVIYGCNRVIVQPTDVATLPSNLGELLRVNVFVRTGCSRCEKARPFIDHLRSTYIGLEFRVRDLVVEPDAVRELDLLIRHYQQSAASTPVFHFCNQLVVGFDHESTTGRRIEEILLKWSYACQWPPDSQANASALRRLDLRPILARTPEAAPVAFLSVSDTSLSSDPETDGVQQSSEPLVLPGPSPPLPGPPLPISRSPPPREGIEDDGPAQREPGTSESPSLDSMDVPVFGRLSVRRLGFPLFTLGVGLVDGFNPCAMWVLLFLLSILVNLKDRWRILAVAGSFVAISGAAYFAFMAAWLNVFRFVGMLRPVQVTLAVLAILIGAIHIKDFVAFKQGVSLSIPDSAKPGIYRRVREIVTAENLLGALIGATVLAVLVNFIELLCTAGLPALYTEILTLQQFPAWKNYCYLGLYNLAYMFDDILMISLAVITLGHHKMQERHGRWLKLISGSAIFVLGVIMLIRPDWLI